MAVFYPSVINNLNNLSLAALFNNLTKYICLIGMSWGQNEWQCWQVGGLVKFLHRKDG